MKKQILIPIITLMFSITVYGQSSKTKTESQRITQKEQTSPQGIAERDCRGAPCYRCNGWGCNNYSADFEKIISKLNTSSKKLFLESFEKLNSKEIEVFVDEFYKNNSNNKDVGKVDIGKSIGFNGNGGFLGVSFADTRAICCRQNPNCCPKSAK